MYSRCFSALVAAVVLAGLVLAAPPTQAAGEVVQETGVVTYIIDGDTVHVTIGKTVKSVRFLGINAMETYHPTIAGTVDHCHGPEAADLLSSLVLGKTVQLRSIYKSSVSGSRLLRSVWVQQNGVWVDVQRILLQNSLALALPWGVETTHNAEYLKLAQQAAKSATPTAIWDPADCKAGPLQDLPINLIVRYDGETADEFSGEWVSIWNQDPTRSLPMVGWTLRDGTNSVYHFTSGTVIAPGSRITVKVGKGSDTTVSKYWGLSAPVFDNGGDGAYLFDADDDLRAWMMYPCSVSCVDPEAGNLRISSASYDPAGTDADHVNGEWVKIHNYSTHRINLRPYMLKSPPYALSFGPDAWIEAGGTVLVRVGVGTANATNKFWGKSTPILNNGGDKVEIVTYDDIVISCKAWGSVSC